VECEGNSEEGYDVKIGIYAPYLETYGGGEKYICTIAKMLSENHDVELITCDKVNMKELKDRLNINLGKVVLRRIKIPSLFKKLPYLHQLMRIIAISRITKEYDLFINQEHFSIIPSLAKRSVLICEVPPAKQNKSLFNIILALFFDPQLKSYDKIITNSFYTRNWVLKYYKKKVEVLYPPVDVNAFSPLPKQNIILNVGRFFRNQHCKKQLEMIKIFKELYSEAEELKTWEFHLVGGISTKIEDQKYLQLCLREAQNYPVFFHINVPFRVLRELYGKGKIYWHATGLYENEEKTPEGMEHFGITIVEAMSAGCVPVVINRGGPREIIRNGIDGFLWNTPKELKEYTIKLVNDQVLWKRMSEASIKRSREFSTERFREQLKHVLELE